MNKENLLLFLEELGADRITNGGEWLNASCPLAKYKHSKGTDRKPSFGVSINDNSESFYKCFTCNIDPKPLSNILHEIWRYSGEYPYELSKLFSKMEVFTDGLKNDVVEPYKDHWIQSVTDKCFDIIPWSVVDCFNKCSRDVKWAHQYLINRGISEKTYTRFDIRVTKTHDLLLLYTNLYGSVMIMEYKSTLQKRVAMFKPEHIGISGVSFPTKKDSGCLFGLHLVDWKKPLLIVEGAIDCMRAYEMGFHNVIATGGTGVTKAQAKQIHSHNVIVGFDTDDAGRQGARRVKKLLDPTTTIWFADWSLIDKKDPAEIRKKSEFEYVMENLKMELATT